MEKTVPVSLRVACIGTGMMGAALMRAVVKVTGEKALTVTDNDTDKARKFAEETGCLYAASNREAVKTADVVFLAVKPAGLSAVFDEIRPLLAKKIVVSIAAGVSLASIREMCCFSAMAPGEMAEPAAFVRLMPNLPALVGEGMIALCTEQNPDAENTADVTDLVASLLACAGKIEPVPERMMDAVTAVSGSGPAYAFMFIEALADAAVRMGMGRGQAYTYAAQTLKGAAVMQLETGRHPADLKDAVCSPAGTTIEAVSVLEKQGFRSAIITAAQAAYERSRNLGQKK